MTSQAFKKTHIEPGYSQTSMKLSLQTEDSWQSPCVMWLSSLVLNSCLPGVCTGDWDKFLQKGFLEGGKGPSSSVPQGAAPRQGARLILLPRDQPRVLLRSLCSSMTLAVSVLTHLGAATSAQQNAAVPFLTSGVPEILSGTSPDFKNIWLTWTVDLYSFPGSRSSTVCALCAPSK